MTERVYAATYNIGPPRFPDSSTLAQSFRVEASKPTSSFDAGDDPSFFSAMHFRGPVTWGVCRPPLRRKLQTGDVVTFFGMDRGEEGIDYYFKGYATVARKVSQVDIWQLDDLRRYREYLNLLIRPKGNSGRTFEWHEHLDCHFPDWLWRICSPDGGKKQEFEELGRRREFTVGELHVAESYVVFSAEADFTRILRDPLHVAHSPPLRARCIETWFDSDNCIKALKALVCGRSSKSRSGQRGLKTTNRYQAHPQLALDLVTDPASWRSKMDTLLLSRDRPEAVVNFRPR